MSEQNEDRQIFTLQEVARSIQKTIANRYGSAYWIRAEINKLNHYPHSGHCFPELVEKKEGKVVAEMRSTLWSTDYKRINQEFLEAVKEPLKDGITVLMLASIQYDPLYGLSLKIHDIDPVFSLGQLELEKVQSIARLKKEGLFHLNKQLPFPLVPKRLAIISVESSKGYADFNQIILNNPHKYTFEMELFPALLQGDRSVASIIYQLMAIKERANEFDVVLIMRGGGGEVGLSSYNHYDLASAIAAFPLPVMTGIGHSTNETVSELVAYRKAITPSELADFLIRHFHDFAEALEQLAAGIRLSVQLDLQNKHHQLSWWSQLLRQATQQQFRDADRKLELLSQQMHLLDPSHVLKRGYSITFDEKGKVVLDPTTLKAGERIRSSVAHGTIVSVVEGLENNKQ